MARIEAGLLLIGTDFTASRFAENDAHRSTPFELGLDWMLRGIEDETRPFIGRRTLLGARDNRTARWKMTGLVVDAADHERIYTAAGLLPPKDHTPIHGDQIVYDDANAPVGYATSSMYSPMMQSHIALARVEPHLAAVGTEVNLEFTVNHRYVKVRARVARTPFFRPARKLELPLLQPAGDAQ